MNPLRYLFFTISLALLLSCNRNVDFDHHFTSFKRMNRHFAEVPPSFRPVPFWVWNGEISKKIIDEQLSDFAEKGFGGVFLHPRYGMVTEYASEEWYDLAEYAARRAKREGIDLWIYDENSYPSGFAGGHVPAEMPSSHNEGQALRLHRQTVFRPDSSKEYLLFQMEGAPPRDITATYDQYLGKEGDFLLFEKIYYPVSGWYAGHSYVDLLKPGVTEKFIGVTMTGYEERLGKQFGGGVPGVFTDEPNIAPQGGKGQIRWTPDLFEQFEQRWGYQLQPHLNALVESTGMSRKVRHNYYQLLLELFIERWSKPWFEYTELQDLAWTGHYWEHGWPSPHHGPDNMAMYAWHQVPGIDMLFNTWEGRPDQFGNIRAVRELNSVANQLGKVRSLSETYGGSGWELTFEDMKRNGDWEFVLGVNMLNQHLSFQSLDGDRKYDYPPSFSSHAPYWEEYTMMNDYFGRLSLALSTGEQINSTLVLEPTTSAWMAYAPSGENIEMKQIGDEFRNLLDLLENENVEYDLGSENIIRDHGSVADDVFVVGNREYNFVVIPQFMQNLNSETADLLEQYLGNGGIIIALCQPPGFIDGAASNRCRQWTRDYAGQWFSLAGCNDPRLISYLHRDNFIVVEQQGGTLFHMRRQLDDGQLLFLVNSNKTETCHARMITRGADLVHLDLISGRAEQYPGIVTDEILSFDAVIHPSGSLLLFISDKEVRRKKSRIRKWTGNSSVLGISDIQTLAEERNALRLDYCNVVLGSDTSGLLYFADAQTDIFEYHGFEQNPWFSAMQYKTEILDRDTFPDGTGFTAQYPFFVESRFRTNDLTLVVERPDLYRVRLNGLTQEPLEEKWWLDRNFGVYRISGGILSGDNLIEITADPMSVFCELQPVYLVGDFDVFALDKGWLLTSPGERTIGSWKEMGMPFYSDKVAYSAGFVLEDRAPVRIRLGEWAGTVATVEVNGIPAGTIFSKPYELRIDNHVKPGENSITVRVTGSLKSLLGPHHNIEMPGFVTPWSFKRAPAEQPSGVDYDLPDYGLFEPFVMEVMN
jgi:hypothetical protein